MNDEAREHLVTKLAEVARRFPGLLRCHRRISNLGLSSVFDERSTTAGQRYLAISLKSFSTARPFAPDSFSESSMLWLMWS